MPLSLLLIDSNAGHIQSVGKALSQWDVRAVDSPAQARGLLASRAFDLAWVAHSWLTEEADARDLLSLLKGTPALVAVNSGGEAQAAYALRYGFDDFVLLDAQGVWLGQLAQQIESVLARARERGGMQAELDRMEALLAEKTRALEITLASVSQGIANFDSDGRIRVYNQRMLELLELPSELFEGEPNMERLVKFQTERGDFGPDFSLIEDPHARHYVMQEYGVGEERRNWPEQYLRRAPSGRYIEIRTRTLKGGGRVRTFSDVTDYIAAQEALRRSEARWRSLTQLSSDWFWEQDAQFRFVRFDGNLTHRIIPTQMSYGRARWEIPHRNVTEAQWRAHRAQLEAHEEFRDFELERAGPDGRSIWASVSGTPIFDAQGRFTGYQGVARDITERKRAEAEIQNLAFYDELTGLPNRRLLLDRLEQAALAHTREGLHGALIFLDLDNFKAINDTMGHEWGDRLLVQVARRLEACARAGDSVARLGGDEFVVVLRHLSADVAEATRQAGSVAHNVLTSLNQPYDVSERLMHSTSSLGITLFGGAQGPSATVAELLQRADLAMYQAKSDGRNTLCFFDQTMQAAATERLALEADLRDGLERGEFLLHYQRVADADGTTLGAEALVRWQHPQRGLVLPGQFIAVAEQSGQILPLGRFVLRAACEQLALWAHDSARRRWKLSVNVSAQEFRHPGFVQQVLHTLEETGADPHCLTLELTESTLLHEVEDSIALMQALRKRGVGLSLDDFGTGYSSLAYLKRLPIQQLKIDQSFVRDVLTDPNDAAIACTVVDLAHSLGLDVVAEGVESEGQLEFLLANGCKRFQGYLFGRPGPAQALL